MNLRDQLRGRALPTEVVRLPLDPTAYARRERAVATAQWALEEARGFGGRDTARLRANLAQAERELEEMVVATVTLRTLPAPEWEALIELHPATEEQQAAGERWNVTTFRPALLAASYVPPEDGSPMTADDWEQTVKAGELGAGEYNTLFNVAVGLNVRTPTSAVGNVY